LKTEISTESNLCILTNKLLAQEIDRLEAIIQNRKDILLGTKNLFPEIEILDKFESVKQQEFKNQEGEICEKEVSCIVSRKYYIKFTHLLDSEQSIYSEKSNRIGSVSDSF
jgi:hypothetical protein